MIRSPKKRYRIREIVERWAGRTRRSARSVGKSNVVGETGEIGTDAMVKSNGENGVIGTDAIEVVLA